MVPTYNGERFLLGALASIDRQTLPPCEIIVVDDGSQDATVELARSFQPAACPLLVIESPRNSGSPARPLNRGIEQARGPLIAILEQDDEFLPDKLASQANALTNDHELAVVFGLCNRLGETSRPGSRSQTAAITAELQAAGAPVAEGYRINGEELFRLLVWRGCYYSGFPGIMFRKSDWEKKGGLRTDWQVGTDLEFFCWLTQQGPGLFQPRHVYSRRLHGESLSASGAAAHADILELFDEYLTPDHPLLAHPQTAASIRMYANRAAWYVTLAGGAPGGYRLWRQARRELGSPLTTTLSSGAVLLGLYGFSAWRRPSSDIATCVERLKAAVHQLAGKCRART
ncbi:Putative glycosyltransferase EpsH [Lignipirellula cremea]|uniref:Glycosyltransferase EpsH n=1 Tax=Lignipirellula cremea TaxID=2528010 RepID=A0A518DUD6_9BACT|nr:Putative glycosyltransferase EpsH [Lignipirellula cremea]